MAVLQHIVKNVPENRQMIGGIHADAAAGFERFLHAAAAQGGKRLGVA